MTQDEKLDLPNGVRRPISIYLVGALLLILALAGGSYLGWKSILKSRLILDWSPTSGQDRVSLRATVRITFTQPMDKNQVLERLSILPTVAGNVTWERDTLVFRPTYPLTANQTYTVTLQAGAQSARGKSLSRETTWSFRTGAPRLIYVAADERERLQLYLDGTPATPLTHHDGDVWDYCLHPEGTTIAYSVMNEDESADIWQVDQEGTTKRLLACPDAACTAPSWSGDGERIAYQRQDLSETTIGHLTGPLVPHIWLLDPDSGETEPLLGESPTPGRHPVWSPTGQRLAFYDLAEQAVQIVDMDSGDQQFFETLSDVGAWDPLGEQMILPDISFHNEVSADYLMMVDVTTRSVQIVDQQPEVDDTAPRWSPTGEWIALGRTMLGDGTRTWGAQLWLIRPDGSEATPLVTDPQANFGAFAWRPDGTALATIRLPLESLADPRPELWIVPLADRLPRHIADDAIMPGWLF